MRPFGFTSTAFQTSKSTRFTLGIGTRGTVVGQIDGQFEGTNDFGVVGIARWTGTLIARQDSHAAGALHFGRTESSLTAAIKSIDTVVEIIVLGAFTIDFRLDDLFSDRIGRTEGIDLSRVFGEGGTENGGCTHAEELIALLGNASEDTIFTLTLEVRGTLTGIRTAARPTVSTFIGFSSIARASIKGRWNGAIDHVVFWFFGRTGGRIVVELDMSLGGINLAFSHGRKGEPLDGVSHGFNLGTGDGSIGAGILFGTSQVLTSFTRASGRGGESKLDTRGHCDGICNNV